MSYLLLMDHEYVNRSLQFLYMYALLTSIVASLVLSALGLNGLSLYV